MRRITKAGVMTELVAEFSAIALAYIGSAITLVQVAAELTRTIA